MFGITPGTAPAPVAASIPSGPFKLDKLKGHIPDAVLAQIPDTGIRRMESNFGKLKLFFKRFDGYF